jgi:hypothetical protein
MVYRNRSSGSGSVALKERAKSQDALPGPQGSFTHLRGEWISAAAPLKRVITQVLCRLFHRAEQTPENLLPCSRQDWTSV